MESGKVNYKFSHFKLNKVVNEVIYNANLMLKSGQHIIYPKDIDNIDVYQDEKILELILSSYFGKNSKKCLIFGKNVQVSTVIGKQYKLFNACITLLPW